MNTRILIRPAARGGKYLGPDAALSTGSMPSALVYLSDAATRVTITAALVNASGKDAGPGNLMVPLSRATAYPADVDTVSATLQVNIDKPTNFIVSVFGPLSHITQAREAEAQITVLPGVDIGFGAPTASAPTPPASAPEGLVLEVPGLCLSISRGSKQPVIDGATLSCTVVVTMMCGCKIGAPGTHAPPPLTVWPWLAKDFDVELVTVMTSGNRYHYPLTIDTTLPQPSSTFTGSWPSKALPTDGRVVQAWLSASQPALGNQGFYSLHPAGPLGALPDHIQAMVGQFGLALEV